MATTTQPLIKLGVLDFCEIDPDSNARARLIDTLRLAAKVDTLGYSRYWLGEHHNPRFAHVSLTTMAMAIAGKTKNLHIGTGALLLNYHNTLRVANDFRLLELLFPKRIDLGVGRGMLADSYEEAFLGTEKTKVADLSYYESKVEDLLLYLRGKNKAVSIPKNVNSPEFWLLGKNRNSMLLAARYGARFSFSLFLGSSQVEASTILAEYNANFRPSKELVKPQCNLAIAGNCTDSQTQIAHLTKIYNHEDANVVPTIIGTPEQCLEKLQELQYVCKVDEFMFLDISTSLEDRIRSYQLLAEVCGLN
jgi:luciferase family oxidoreductase group 1